MRRVLFPLYFACLLPPTAAAVSATVVRNLVPCEVELDDQTINREFADRIIDRYRGIGVQDFPYFRGHILTAGRTRRILEAVLLPELNYGSAAWDIQDWSFGATKYYSYNIGSRNLELDSSALHASMIAVLQRMRPGDALVLEASETRRRDLANLMRFQVAFERRSKDLHGTGLDGLKRGQVPTALRDLTSNTDVIGILDRRLRPDAARRAIERALVAGMKITYSPARDFVRPNFSGLAGELGLGVTGPTYLPSLTRLSIDENRRRRFDAEFADFFGTGPVCEFGFIREMQKAVPPQLRQRLLYQSYNLARRRGCKTIMLSATDRDAGEFIAYGFKAWRGTPLDYGRREKLYTLDVKSPPFNSALSDLNTLIRAGAAR